MELTPARSEKLTAARQNEYGLALLPPRDEQSGGRAFLTLIRGILIFLATFGTIGGLTSSFGLKYNPVTVGIGLLAISVAIAFTYYNKVTFYAGYVLLFLAFMMMYVLVYIYINSGFQAFLNEVYAAYSDFFLLPSTRETTEYITDRSVTVPAAMLFTGAGFAILLNISISAYMDLFTTFLLTFLPMQLAFYIDIIPPMPYLVMLITVYITVAILGRSGRFRLPYRYRKGQQYAMKTGRHKEKYEYLASGSGMIQLSLISAVLTVCLMLLLSGVFGRQFSTRFVSNGVKDRTDDYVKMLAQGGVTSLFNRYNATGGISHGRLGGISAVSSDYETDIIARIVPISSEEGEKRRMDPVYLKAYTGVWYENDQFLSAIPGKVGATEILSADDYIPVGANYMDTGMKAYMKMWIMNVDADNTYDFRPYYTLFSGSGRGVRATGLGTETLRFAQAGLHAQDVAASDAKALSDWVMVHKEDPETNPSYYEIIYTPYATSDQYEPNPEITEEYERYVYDTYLGINDELLKTVEITAKEAGLDKISVSPLEVKVEGIHDDYREYLAAQRQRLQIAEALKKYYEDNYRYTVMPGTTPIGRDTVEYFLSELKRGYCVHYAASSTLILRSMGIPARYIEGYVINPTDVIEGESSMITAEDWVIGTGSDKVLSGEIAVVDVEIPDANAHAWTEIYIDGYGWIPYEFTPPSGDEDIGQNGFADFFAALFTRTSRGTVENDTNVTTNDIGVIKAANRFNNSKIVKAIGSADFLLKPLIIVAGVMLLIFAVMRFYGSVITLYRLKKHERSGEYDEALLLRYRGMLTHLYRKGMMTKEHPTVNDVVEMLKDDAIWKDADGRPDDDEIIKLGEIVNSAAYGTLSTRIEEYKRAVRVIRFFLYYRDKVLLYKKVANDE